ncbi:hypothetical protein JHK82_055376 [Glycine max]|nr:hypothetical protein JHK86_055214 [Glycine max]KAG4917916.1 hypothetical protein JHK85_056197 [Glycine max]KAG5074009.1 hypothetical protein JHK84_055240 [Glycine max]KAG5076681.1 hypothetical protein JHK82_055376 [Glycine max]
MAVMGLFQNPSFVKSYTFETLMWIAKLVLMGAISTLLLLKKLAKSPILLHYSQVDHHHHFSFLQLPSPTSDPKHTTTISLDTANHPTKSENQTNEPKEEQKKVAEDEEQLQQQQVRIATIGGSATPRTTKVD